MRACSDAVNRTHLVSRRRLAWALHAQASLSSNGYPSCTSDAAGPYQQTVAQVGCNNVVVIYNALLKANRARLCGKKVLVYKNGKQVSTPDGDDFFVWDGCAACAGGVKIDFSVSN